MTDINKQDGTAKKWQLDRNININHILGILGIVTATISWVFVATIVGLKWSNEITRRIDENAHRIEFNTEKQQELVSRFTKMHEDLKVHLWKIDGKIDNLANNR